MHSTVVVVEEHGLRFDVIDRTQVSYGHLSANRAIDHFDAGLVAA